VFSDIFVGIEVRDLGSDSEGSDMEGENIPVKVALHALD
jgi:hypothetical protein